MIKIESYQDLALVTSLAHKINRSGKRIYKQDVTLGCVAY